MNHFFYFFVIIRLIVAYFSLINKVLYYTENVTMRKQIIIYLKNKYK
jgi:hypothetical protein